MLALPATVGIAGLLPSLLLFLLCWSFMMYTAFLILEVNQTIGGTANLITMARRTLGRWGEVVAWILSLSLLYALTAAYLSGSGAIIEQESGLSTTWGPIPVVLLFGCLVFFGIRPVDYLNRILMVGLALSFLMMVGAVVPHVEPKLLLRSSPGYALFALPIVITSFGYHIIIPSLASYLDHDLRKIRIAMVSGSLLPLAVYLLWLVAILGVVPLGGLVEAFNSGQPAVALSESLEQLLNAPWIGRATTFCSLFAILTSVLGVSIALSDCLADGLGIEKSRPGRLLLSLMTFIPPLFFTWFYPRGFIIALSYGGLFVSLLLGIFPALMVWSERYWRLSKTDYQTVGGRGALMVTILFFLGVVGVQLFLKSKGF